MGGDLRLSATKDPRLTAYIESAPAFARPILKELRRRIHAAVPDVVETIKWSGPFFEYDGRILCGMMAWKAHCAFGFWHAAMRDGDTSLEGLGQLRLESTDDLPPERDFARLARKATKLIDDGAKPPARPKPDPKRSVAVPPDLSAALRGNARARAAFEAFSPSHRAEYVKWIEEAKREETRGRRVATTVEWLAEGKKLYWKYEGR